MAATRRRWRWTPVPPISGAGHGRRTHAFDDIAGENGTVIVFICNHAPT